MELASPRGVDARIERRKRNAATDARVIALGGGLPDPRTFPRKHLGRALKRALAAPDGAALQYGWPEGSERVRTAIAERLRSRGVAVAASDVLVTSGAQQAIAITAQLLAREGQPVEVDAETYPAALAMFRARGLCPGTNRDRAAFTYVMPALQNPRGVGMSPSARTTLLASGRPILEDDAYGELRFAGPPPPPLLSTARDRVHHVGTFSKTLCPGLRVGWLVPPPAYFPRALALKQALDLQANSLAQAVLEVYLDQIDFDARLETLRAFYARRAERLADAMRRLAPAFRFAAPEGGFSIWVETDAPGDDVDLLDVSLGHGVSFDPGREFRTNGATSPLSFRLSFASGSLESLQEGVRRLVRAFDAYQAQRRARAVTPPSRGGEGEPR